MGKHAVRLIKLWNGKTTDGLKIQKVQETWNIAVVQCTQAHFTLKVDCQTSGETIYKT